jgi:hypothetical protein
VDREKEKNINTYSDQAKKEHVHNRLHFANLQVNTKAQEKNADSIIKYQENKLFRLD